MPYTIEVEKSYTFITQVPAILGTDFTNAKVLGKLSFTAASRFSDVAALHAQLIAYLAPGTSSDARSLNYILIQTTGQDMRVLAEEWLVAQPVESGSTSVRMVVNCTPSRWSVLESLLEDNGFGVVSRTFL